jgi:hypothetical protein
MELKTGQNILIGLTSTISSKSFVFNGNLWSQSENKDISNT